LIVWKHFVRNYPEEENENSGRSVAEISLCRLPPGRQGAGKSACIRRIRLADITNPDRLLKRGFVYDTAPTNVQSVSTGSIMGQVTCSWYSDKTDNTNPAIGHWLSIASSSTHSPTGGPDIGNYEVITPTCWNASPKDTKEKGAALCLE
jgi:Ni,Fe-hydrogenase I large subunit